MAGLHRLGVDDRPGADGGRLERHMELRPTTRARHGGDRGPRGGPAGLPPAGFLPRISPGLQRLVLLLPGHDGLLHTSDLLGGELHEAGQTQLELDECVEAMAADGVIAADHFPVAASLESIDVALMGKPGTPAAGTVSWVRGEVIERYDDFLDYYLSMMELNKLDTADIRQRLGPKPDSVPHAVIDYSKGIPIPGNALRDTPDITD